MNRIVRENMRLKINSERSVMFLVIALLKSRFDKIIQWIKTKTRADITVEGQYLTLTNKTHRTLAIQNFERQVKRGFIIDLRIFGQFHKDYPESMKQIIIHIS